MHRNGKWPHRSTLYIDVHRTHCSATRQRCILSSSRTYSKVDNKRRCHMHGITMTMSRRRAHTHHSCYWSGLQRILSMVIIQPGTATIHILCAVQLECNKLLFSFPFTMSASSTFVEWCVFMYLPVREINDDGRKRKRIEHNPPTIRRRFVA